MTAGALSKVPENLTEHPLFFRCERMHVVMKKTVCVDRMMRWSEVEKGRLTGGLFSDPTKLLWLSNCKDCEVGERNRKEVLRMSEAAGPYEIKKGDGAVLKKICKKCGETKPMEDFDKAKSTRDGRLGSCKACRRAYRLTLKKRKRAEKAAPKVKNPAAVSETPTPSEKPQLVLIGGLPGSGKTTRAKREFPEFLHYETDHIFTDVGGRYRFNAQIWRQAQDMVFALADLGLSSGESVVVCDLFHRSEDVAPYKELAEYHGAELTHVRCFGTRRSVHPVPLTVMRRLNEEAVWKGQP